MDTPDTAPAPDDDSRGITAAIIDPQAINFITTSIRPAAEAELAAYSVAKSVVNLWNSRGLAAKIPNTTDPVSDGNTSYPILSQDAVAIITYCQGVVTDLEANSNAKLGNLLKVVRQG